MGRWTRRSHRRRRAPRTPCPDAQIGSTLSRMPIVDVELVSASDGTVAPGLARSLADAVGRTLNSPPGQTWVRLRVLPQEHYAENGPKRQAAELPVFVTVLKRSIPGASEMEAEVTALTHIIAAAVGRTASCVHIEYAPAAGGRLSFGGRLVE